MERPRGHGRAIPRSQKDDVLDTDGVSFVVGLIEAFELGVPDISEFENDQRA